MAYLLTALSPDVMCLSGMDPTNLVTGQVATICDAMLPGSASKRSALPLPSLVLVIARANESFVDAAVSGGAAAVLLALSQLGELVRDGLLGACVSHSMHKLHHGADVWSSEGFLV